MNRPSSLREKLHNLCLRLLPEPLAISPQRITLSSGIQIDLDSKLSLDNFAEIFITKPYAPALDLLPRVDFVADLGAARGLFLLYALHRLRERGQADTPRFVCVEAARENLARLNRQIQLNSLTGQGVAVHGAVSGQRTGLVHFYYHPRGHLMGLIVKNRRLTTRTVPIVDLARILDAPRIDLLKMDIEGAEEAVLQEYPDVLRKTEVLVAEFHLHQVDYAHCRAALEESGMIFYRRTFSLEDKLCVDVYAQRHILV